FLASPQFRDHLEFCRDEKIFAYVSVDEDDPNASMASLNGRRSTPLHVRELERLSVRQMLPAGYRVWRPSFVAENFTLDEVATVATRVLRQEGIEKAISPHDIEHAARFKPDGTQRP